MENHNSGGRWGVALAMAAFMVGCAEEEMAPPTLVGSVEVSGDALGELGGTGVARGFDLLVVTLDTVRADHLGCYGHTAAKTPTIDGLARRGVLFRETITSTPITLPSHSTLFTGLSPLEHGVRNNGSFSLGSEHETLAESLRSAGYRTAAFIGAYVLDARYGLDQGFDHYDDKTNPHGLGRVSGHFNERSAAQVTDAALAWLKREVPGAGGTPLFTWVHYFDAHAPYEPPGRFGPEFKAQPYDGEIAFIDSQLKRLLQQLEDSGRLEKTLVVITSDHGEGLGEHGEETHSRLLYDSTLRVPLIFSAPAVFSQAFEVNGAVASLADVCPTVLDLLGVDVPLAVTGKQLFTGNLDGERAVYVETLVPLFNHGWAPLQGLHRLEDKFISAPRPEYYRLKEDPGELSNLFGTASREALDLRGELERLLDGQGTAESLAASEGKISSSDAQRMAALGYTRGSSGGALGQLDPKDMMPVWRTMNEASSLSMAGQNSVALKKIKQVLQGNPKDAYALETASLIYTRMGNHAQAESYLTKSLQQLPSAEGYVRLAQLQLARKSFAEMEGSLKRAADLDPREGGVFMVRGDALASQGRWPEALTAFQQALLVDAVKWSKEANSKLEQVRARMR